jgi:hypothetical protein
MGGAPATSEAALPAGSALVPALPASSNNSSDARTRDSARTRERDVR